MDDILIKAAARYWNARNSNSDGRSMLHNVLLDIMSEAGMDYEDREDAAQISLGLLRNVARVQALNLAISAMGQKYDRGLCTQYSDTIPEMIEHEFVQVSKHLITLLRDAESDLRLLTSD